MRLRSDTLRASFRHAVELIEANIATRNERYNIPWVLVLNEGADAGRLPIAQSGVASMLSAESASAASTQGIGWEFFDHGIVIDLQGEYLARLTMTATPRKSPGMNSSACAAPIGRNVRSIRWFSRSRHPCCSVIRWMPVAN